MADSPAYCTACGKTIVSCFDGCLHPLLNVLVCKKCHESYGDGDFSSMPDHQDEDGYDNYCRWCVDGGNLLVCGNEDYTSNAKCHFSFCEDCIRRNIPDFDLNKLSVADPFNCFACNPAQLDQLRKESLDVLKRLSEQFSKSSENDNDKCDRADSEGQAETFSVNDQMDEETDEEPGSPVTIQSGVAAECSSQGDPIPLGWNKLTEVSSVEQQLSPAKRTKTAHTTLALANGEINGDRISQPVLKQLLPTDKGDEKTDTRLKESTANRRAIVVAEEKNRQKRATLDGSILESQNMTERNMKNFETKLDADAYITHLKRDEVSYLNYNPRVFSREELTKQLKSIENEKKVITSHFSKFFNRLMEECQSCIDENTGQYTSRVLLNLIREQSWIEVKNLLIMYRKVDSLIESLPVD